MLKIQKTTKDNLTTVSCNPLDLLKSEKIINWDEVNEVCHKWSNKLQYDALVAKLPKDEDKDIDWSKAKTGQREEYEYLKESDKVNYESTDSFIRALTIGAGWSFGKFGTPAEFSAVMDKVRAYVIAPEDSAEELSAKKALATALNSFFDTVSAGHVTFEHFTVSGKNAAKFALACYKLRNKNDIKAGISYVTDGRLPLEKCYKEACLLLCKMLGVYKENKVKTVTVAYMA